VEQSKIVKRISQLQETLATQHTKIYLADDELILSGANLETAYFTNRQDRYIQVIHLFFENSFTRKFLVSIFSSQIADSAISSQFLPKLSQSIHI
jgi:phosphatidylserine/phosphatidylglycerophosphate/cardiolipin synthase-like enzyme